MVDTFILELGKKDDTKRRNIWYFHPHEIMGAAINADYKAWYKRFDSWTWYAFVEYLGEMYGYRLAHTEWRNDIRILVFQREIDD